MTVSTQVLQGDSDAIIALQDHRHDEEFQKELGKRVREVVNRLGDSRLKEEIARVARDLIRNWHPTVERVVDQRFDRKLEEEVDKEIAKSMAASENQSAIGEVVNNAVKAKLTEFKNKASVRTQKRRGK